MVKRSYDAEYIGLRNSLIQQQNKNKYRYALRQEGKSTHQVLVRVSLLGFRFRCHVVEYDYSGAYYA